ncbi:EAL domain-containing protein [Nakamurella sp. YIM 132087]|uniref:EAL domain-containing protein n=1 Tax=Nakamurella alba TaxID=2665158 RepID=A0A7K1FQ51_9ACTN|nr:EAL domain-containing protein [Nakamurella alba]MTD14934.1 EAL domain-containing protein [Nakamurella alba]
MPSSRRHRSALHYLVPPDRTSALQQSVELLAKYFGFPIALVNVVDDNVQHTIAGAGVHPRQVGNLATVCRDVIDDARPQVLEIDVAVGDRRMLTYVGLPLVGREGLPIGTLCLLHPERRGFSARQLQDLAAAGGIVQEQLELRRLEREDLRLTVANALALGEAIDTGRITAHFQPVVGLVSGRTVGLEALARWEHPQLGLLSPSAFLPLAETSDMVVDLDLAVIGHAARHFAPWFRRDPRLRLHVNLSARHFEQADCVERIAGRVASAGIPSTAVDLEVTETAMLSTGPITTVQLHALRDLGFRIVLDDFGTGFSSVAHLMRMPVDGIKIDRSVTTALGSRTGDALLRALLSLAHDLDLDTCIEGVESPEQVEQANAAGCATGQGFLWSRPQPACRIDQQLGSPPAIPGQRTHPRADITSARRRAVR